MISTTEDVAVFLLSLAEGELLNEEERDIYREVYFFSHSGWVPGYQSIARHEQGLGAVVVLFLNNTGGNSEEVLDETYQNIVRVLR